MSALPPTTANVLCWPKKVLSADDLRRHLTSQRELLLLPKTVITPLAADELRAKGVRVLWQVQAKKTTGSKADGWCYAMEQSEAMIRSTIQALERDGITLSLINGSPTVIAETILRDGHCGGLVFAIDAPLVCCITNKIAGMRAVSVSSVAQVIRSKQKLGANLFAIETAGRTFFELRQMSKAIVTGIAPCPDDIAKVLKELDGHAHR